MKSDIVKKQKTSWHRLLARLLELVLSPLNIEVSPNVSVMTEPPEADILLLRRQSRQWTAAQRDFLPDGIRDSNASRILIKFKSKINFGLQKSRIAESNNDELKWFMAGLRKIWSVFLKGESNMKMKFTPEEVTEFGK